MLSSSSKPKFAFNLTINDLTNVPEINGSCYIELQIRDGTRRSFHTSISITVAVVAIMVILMVKILKNQVPTLVTPMVLNPHP